MSATYSDDMYAFPTIGNSLAPDIVNIQKQFPSRSLYAPAASSEGLWEALGNEGTHQQIAPGVCVVQPPQPQLSDMYPSYDQDGSDDSASEVPSTPVPSLLFGDPLCEITALNFGENTTPDVDIPQHGTGGGMTYAFFGSNIDSYEYNYNYESSPAVLTSSSSYRSDDEVDSVGAREEANDDLERAEDDVVDLPPAPPAAGGIKRPRERRSSTSSNGSTASSKSRKSGSKSPATKSPSSKKSNKNTTVGPDGQVQKRQRVRCFDSDEDSSCTSHSGILQCKGINRKRKTRCRNAALMEYVGPRPLYCAEHIGSDPNALYHKCGFCMPATEEGGLTKRCKEIVYKDFKRCYKHAQDWLDEDLQGPDAIEVVESCLETAMSIAARLETEANAAKSTDQELYQRKSKLLPKYQITVVNLRRHLGALSRRYGSASR